MTLSCISPQFVGRVVLAVAVSTVMALTAGQAFGQSGDSARVPFDLPQFQDVLSESRLQSPATSNAVVQRGEFEGFSLPGRFYLAEDGSTMVLATTVDGRDRSELRHNQNWSVAGGEKRLTANLRFDKPVLAGGKDRLHFLQIHINDFLGNAKGPLLMVSAVSERDGKSDHVWAQVRQEFSPKGKANKQYDLGPRPDEFTTYVISVEEGILRIFVNDEMRVEDDVSVFSEAPVYFKTGCYYQGIQAPQAVEYRSLTITGTDQASGADDPSLRGGRLGKLSQARHCLGLSQALRPDGSPVGKLSPALPGLRFQKGLHPK